MHLFDAYEGLPLWRLLQVGLTFPQSALFYEAAAHHLLAVTTVAFAVAPIVYIFTEVRFSLPFAILTKTRHSETFSLLNLECVWRWLCCEYFASKAQYKRICQLRRSQRENPLHHLPLFHSAARGVAYGMCSICVPAGVSNGVRASVGVHGSLWLVVP